MLKTVFIFKVYFSGFQYSSIQTEYPFWYSIGFKYSVLKSTVEPRYSAHNREMSKSMLYQSVHYIEVPYNFTLKIKLEQF